jgi:serine/threonine-protein kinase HipA
MRRGEIFFQSKLAGILTETDTDYIFQYDEKYLSTEESTPISLTLPLRKEPYRNSTLFPFFDGLIPEGWLLSIAEKNWKINPRDRMGLLLACCRDCIGAVSVREAS